MDAHFIPLFFYESVLSLLGVAVLLFLWRRFTARGRLLIAGDVGLLYLVWYGVERSLLETLRSGWDWTFFGIPMAQLVGLGAAAAAIVAHLRPALVGSPPSRRRPGRPARYSSRRYGHGGYPARRTGGAGTGDLGHRRAVARGTAPARRASGPGLGPRLT